MTSYLKKITPVLLLALNMVSAVSCAEEYMQAQAAIDVNTVVSDGRYTLSQIADIARGNNIRIVIPTDGFLNRWEYGLWPLRNIIKKVMDINSVSKYGVKRYLEMIKNVQRKNADMIFIPAVETGPFYYWEGSPFGNKFTIKDWHKHLLVMGLDNEADYKGLPVIGNGLSLVKPFGIDGLAYITALIAIFIFGLFCIFRGAASINSSIYERWLGLPVIYWHRIGWIIALSAAVLFINGFPFSSFKFDQYHGNMGAAPYQKLINYVKSRGGVTFWEHPEAKNVDKLDNISIETGAHADYLLSTYGYTGYAVFYEGYEQVGAPDRIWDEALKDYCTGVRPLPIWAIGAMDFEKAGNLDECMKNLRTVFLLSHFTKADALSALKEGRMYISKEKDASKFVLDKFTVKDIATGAEKIMGQELNVTGDPKLTVTGHFSDSRSKSVRITIIRNGEMIKIMDAETPFKIDYEDKDHINADKFYYRLEIRSESLVLVTNPIFVKKR